MKAIAYLTFYSPGIVPGKTEPAWRDAQLFRWSSMPFGAVIAALVLTTVGVVGQTNNPTYFNAMASRTLDGLVARSTNARLASLSRSWVLSSFPDLLRSAGEPSLVAQPSDGVVVFRYALLGNYVNSGCATLRIEITPEASLLKLNTFQQQLSGYGRLHSVSRSLTREEHARLTNQLAALRLDDPAYEFGEEAIDAPVELCEVRTRTHHFVLARPWGSKGDVVSRLFGFAQGIVHRTLLQQTSPANGSQPSRLDTNRTSPAAGSRR